MVNAVDEVEELLLARLCGLFFAGHSLSARLQLLVQNRTLLDHPTLLSQLLLVVDWVLLFPCFTLCNLAHIRKVGGVHPVIFSLYVLSV